MTLVGLAVLLVEAGAANREAGRRGELPWARWMRRVSLPGAFLLGLSTFQAEFDFGVPQFRMIFQPMLIMLAAGVALVAARIWLGRGAALGAALFFLAMRGLMALLVGPVLGEPLPHFPLFLVEAVLVELIALRVRRAAAARRWPRAPRSAPSGSPPSGAGRTSSCRCRGRPRWCPRACCSGSRWRSRARCVGALDRRAAGATTGRRRCAPRPCSAAVVDLRADRLRAAAPAGDRACAGRLRSRRRRRHGNAEVRVDPRDGADDADWLTATSWQGGGLVVDRLRAVGARRLPHDRAAAARRRVEDDDPPAHGRRADRAAGLPARRPGDPGRGRSRRAAARARVRRRARSCSSASARRAAGWLWATAYGAVLALALGFLALLAWGVHRVSRRPGRRRGASLGSANVSQHFVPHDLRALGVSRVEPLAGLAERLVVVPRGQSSRESHVRRSPARSALLGLEQLAAEPAAAVARRAEALAHRVVHSLASPSRRTTRVITVTMGTR